jgi:hypothetical protein
VAWFWIARSKLSHKLEIEYTHENDQGDQRADDLLDNELGVLAIIVDLKFAQSLAHAIESDVQATKPACKKRSKRKRISG